MTACCVRERRGGPPVCPDSNYALVWRSRWFNTVAGAAKTVFKSSSHQARIDAAVAGAGIACLPRFHADSEVGLRRLEPPSPAPDESLWLATHIDNKRTMRVRTVLDAIAEMVTMKLREHG